jgi:hypothetical protein
VSFYIKYDTKSSQNIVTKDKTVAGDYSGASVATQTLIEAPETSDSLMVPEMFVGSGEGWRYPGRINAGIYPREQYARFPS